MSKAKETAVREAAAALRVAIIEAEAAGLRVTFPRTVDSLDAVVISETGRAAPPVAADEHAASRTRRKAGE